MSTLSTKKRIVAAVAAASIVVGGGTAVAFAAASPSAATTLASTSPLPSTSPPALHHRHRGLLAHSDYGTAEVKQHKNWVTVTLNRGKVTAVTSSLITLLRPDGQSVTIPLGATTHYRGLATSAATVQTGKRATVISEGGIARTVRVGKVRPAHHKTAKAHKVAPATTATPA